MHVESFANLKLNS